MAHIVCKNCFLFQVEIKKNSCQRDCFGSCITDQAAPDQLAIPLKLEKYFFQANLGLEVDSKMHQSHGGSSDDLALQYFSMINKSSTKFLYEMYKMDFLMFNYDPTPYFKISRKDK